MQISFFLQKNVLLRCRLDSAEFAESKSAVWVATSHIDSSLYSVCDTLHLTQNSLNMTVIPKKLLLLIIISIGKF